MFVRVKGVRIHYEAPHSVRGDCGRIILLVHGASGTLNVWEPQIEHLGNKHTPIAVDLPGHGDSDGEPVENLEEFTKFILEFCRELQIGKTVYCGHSMGGAIGLLLAVTDPSLFDGLVLVGSGAKFNVSPDRIGRMLEDSGNERIEARTRIFSRNTSLSLIERVEYESGRNRPEIGLADTLACSKYDIRDQVGKISIPTLVLCGKEDYLVEQASFLHEQIRGSTLDLISDASHIPTLEQPHDVNSSLSRFLESLANR